MRIGVTKIISSAKDAAGRLLLKVLFRGAIIDGRGDIQQPIEAGPYGVDSTPIAGKAAIYASTEVYGAYYSLGVLNTKRKAEPGEIRLFCTDENGNFKFNLWLRADGTMLAGTSEAPADYVNFAVKYNQAKIELDKTNTYLTTLRTATQTALVAVDAVIPGTSATFISAMGTLAPGNYANMKNDKFKTT